MFGGWSTQGVPVIRITRFMDASFIGHINIGFGTDTQSVQNKNIQDEN
jgi:hypothetical protein